MFNSVYNRVMAAAAMVAMAVGMRRDEPVRAPHRTYNPSGPAIDPVRLLRGSERSTVSRAMSWGKWRYPRKPGAEERRRNQIERLQFTPSNGLLWSDSRGRVTHNSHGQLIQFYS